MAKNKKQGKGKERPPPVDKLIKPAIGIGLALLAYQFFNGIKAEIPRINVEDELELRQVFFGEETTSNYVVLCHPEDATYQISSVFQDAYNDGSAPAEFKLLDCKHVLSSEKTVYERFKLDEKKRPTVFVSGKVGNPKQVPTKHLKTGSMLVKALKNLLVPKAEKVETTQDLRSKCLDKDICGLLLKGGKQSPNYVKDAMSKLLVEFPKVTFAAVDTSVLYVKGLEAEFLPELVTGQPRFVVFEKVVDPKNKDRLKTSVATLPGNGVAYGPMSNLVGSVVQKTATMQKVTSLPTIKTRTKKLEEEERAKRQRRTEQQRRQDSGDTGGSTTPGGYFAENDGSKEGRKAERERRRAEHRANNPDYREKTPEEIAEMERQRRKRMEEEAAKWNMAPEDETGDGTEQGGEGGGSQYFEEQVYDDFDGDEEEEDDEDILDLD